MATTPSKSTSSSTSSTAGATPLAADPGPAPSTTSDIRPDGLTVDIPMEDGRIVPTPGDVRTEPVATARESHVAGRVGPATIQEDLTAPWAPAGADLDESAPGSIRTDTPEGTGPVPAPLSADPQGEYLAALSTELDALDVPKRQGPVQDDPELRRRVHERVRGADRA